ncbi:MAG: glycosyltransferase [Cyanobacteriota bacterium]|nr:glycosyltransferase [Cyanobacteriota bacterium]
MKVAIISSGFLPVVDGVTVTALYRLKKLSEWGHEVLFFCPDYSSLETVYPNWRDYAGNILPGVRVINLHSTQFMDLDFERNVSIKSYKTLLEELEKFQPDIVHVDEPERLFFGFFRRTGIDYAKKAHIPCVCFFRTNFLEYADDYFPLPPAGIAAVSYVFKKIFLWIYNSYDLTMFTSPITYEKNVKMGVKNGVYANLLGFDSDKFNPGFREEGFFARNYQLPEIDTRVKLIFVSRLTPDKGWGFGLKAFARVKEIVNLDNVAILVAGDGPMLEEIEDKFRELNLNLYLLGRVAPEKMPALFANSDIHATNSEKENRGLTIIEAFASGIPVIAPRAGGVVENIEDGVNGFLYVPQDVEDFARKLKLLIENSNLREEMGRKGLECVGKYDWEESVSNLVAIWEEQINN